MAAPKLLVSAALLLTSTSASAQQSEPARYSPPVHIQPVAWSVLEDKPATENDRAEPGSKMIDAARAHDIANMAHYMRRQNEAVTYSKDAQVNAALFQLQQSRAMAAQGQAFPRQSAAPQYAYPKRAPAAERTEPTQTAFGPKKVASASPGRVTANRSLAAQPIPGKTKAVAPRRRIGLQDRISLAIKRTFARPEPPQQQQAPTQVQAPAQVQAQAQTRRNDVDVPENRRQSIMLVDHTIEATNGLEPELPMLAPEDPPVATPAKLEQSVRPVPMPKPVRNLEYQRRITHSDRVVVPSFVEAEPHEPMHELVRASGQAATAAQGIVGSGVRRPRVTSQSKPMGYGASASRSQVSVFRNASSPALAPQEKSDAERLRELESSLDSREPSNSDSELPQRPSEDEGPSLLDMDDEDNRDEARKARSEVDAEMDALEDEDDFDFDEEDDSPGKPPVFDERGCDELRGLLLDKSIRDISLDLSPPASSRRLEMGNISRSWTDASGNVLATGTMVDLRRGYVILDSGQKLPYAKLGEADWAAISENWLLPSVCSVGQRGSLARSWAPQTVTWHASSLCHKPLYFENIQLERYGHSRGPFMQPIHSAVHFFGSILFLPYNSAINPPNECQYSLGLYRPGSCAPWLLDPIPFSRAGIRRQALASVGLAFIP